MTVHRTHSVGSSAGQPASRSGQTAPKTGSNNPGTSSGSPGNPSLTSGGFYNTAGLLPSGTGKPMTADTYQPGKSGQPTDTDLLVSNINSKMYVAHAYGPTGFLSQIFHKTVNNLQEAIQAAQAVKGSPTSASGQQNLLSVVASLQEKLKKLQDEQQRFLKNNPSATPTPASGKTASAAKA